MTESLLNVASKYEFLEKPVQVSQGISAENIIGIESRNIGQIVMSTLPISDAGLHLLDGALISGEGIYEDFVNYIESLYTNGGYTNLFETEANWQASVNTYGVCGKFVYDSVNNTVRLPKITGFTQGTIDPTVLGDLVEAGLPNITGGFGLWGNGSSGTYASPYGAFSQTQDASGSYAKSGSSATTGAADFNASRSSSIYGNSTTVQPQAIKVLYYIVIATLSKPSVAIKFNNIITDLNGKADTDLVNINDNGKISIAHNAMPSSTYVTLTAGASSASYAAPADGYFQVEITATTNGGWMAIQAGQLNLNIPYVSSGGNAKGFIPIKKGESCYIWYGNSTLSVVKFVYAVGSESEYTQGD